MNTMSQTATEPPLASRSFSRPRIVLLTFALFSLVRAQLSTPPSTLPPRCTSGCKFRSCLLGNRIVLPEGAFKALRPRGMEMPFLLCRQKGRGSRYFATYNITLGEPSVKFHRRGLTKYVPISEFKPLSVNETYPKQLFKPVSVGAGLPPRGFALAKALSPPQFLALTKHCIRIPIHHWQFQSRNGRLMPVRSRRPLPNDCFEFRASAHVFRILLQWDIGDDLDLIVDEPRGFRIDRRSPRSPISGCTLSTDDGIRNETICSSVALSEGFQCSKVSEPDSGVYTIFLKRQTLERNSCGVDTPWRITVIQNGTITQRRRGIMPQNAELSGPYRVVLDESFA